MNIPFHFVDEMTKGMFKSFKHTHTFSEENGTTKMTDFIVYETPFWPFGKLFDYLILHKYLTRFIQQRNQVIKQIAEKQ